MPILTMHDAKPNPASIAWHVPVAVEDVPEAGEHFRLTADSQTRTAIAKVAGLRDLPRLEANFDVSRQGSGGLRVAGRVAATVGQTCVVTLEPVVNEVAEEIDLVFVPQPPVAQSGGATAADASEYDTEPLIGGVVDLGALAVEFLMLGLDPYPRKPGAVFQSPQQTVADESPFSSLAALKKSSNAK
jgi:Large ribosomal RNA subunit accumulation protein YceD